VAEWLKAPVLKTGRDESPSWVRIPPPPPHARSASIRRERLPLHLSARCSLIRSTLKRRPVEKNLAANGETAPVAAAASGVSSKSTPAIDRPWTSKSLAFSRLSECLVAYRRRSSAEIAYTVLAADAQIDSKLSPSPVI
jgi:hypothetical protein